MVGSQTVFSILDEAAAAIGGWTSLQSIRCVIMCEKSIQVVARKGLPIWLEGLSQSDSVRLQDDEHICRHPAKDSKGGHDIEAKP